MKFSSNGIGFGIATAAIGGAVAYRLVGNEDWLEVIERLGFPTAVVCAIFWALWRLLNWFRPHAEAIVTDHREFVKVTSSAVKDIRESIRVQVQTNAEAERDRSELLDEVKEQHDETRKTVMAAHTKSSDRIVDELRLLRTDVRNNSNGPQ